MPIFVCLVCGAMIMYDLQTTKYVMISRCSTKCQTESICVYLRVKPGIPDLFWYHSLDQGYEVLGRSLGPHLLLGVQSKCCPPSAAPTKDPHPACCTSPRARKSLRFLAKSDTSPPLLLPPALATGHAYDHKSWTLHHLHELCSTSPQEQGRIRSAPP